MALEIERKFRLPAAPAWLGDYPASQIEQGYLVIGDRIEVRLRRADSRRALTVKTGLGEVRKEAEAEIDARQFWAFWPLTASRRLRKTRHRVPLASVTVEIDVYSGQLEGLIVAEIEFESERQSHDFKPPEWLGQEVTGDERYANKSLVETGPPEVPSGSAQATGTELSISSRAQRTISRAGEQRKAQIAAGTVAVAGAALAGKMGLERLRNGANDSAGPSRAYRLNQGERVKQGVRRIARGRAQNVIDALQSPDAEAVHEARKDLKKLRSLLRLVRTGLGKRFYRTENRRFRDAGARLSVARDAEVKLQTLAALRSRFPDDLDGNALEGYAKVLEQERRLAGESLDSGAVSETLDEVTLGRNRVSGWKLKARGWELVGPGLARSYRRGRKRMRDVVEAPTDAAVHEWRKRVKDLWYQLRVVRDAWPQVIEATADQAHELTELLGDHHDLAVIAADVRGRPELFGHREGADALLGVAARRQDELLGDAIELGRRLYAEKPKDFERRFKAYWLAWRPR